MMWIARRSGDRRASWRTLAGWGRHAPEAIPAATGEPVVFSSSGGPESNKINAGRDSNPRGDQGALWFPP